MQDIVNILKIDLSKSKTLERYQCIEMLARGIQDTFLKSFISTYSKNLTYCNFNFFSLPFLKNQQNFFFFSFFFLIK